LTVFVDTSALFALLDAEDAGHAVAFPAWSSGIDDCAGFVTTNYVLVETISLVQRRLGIDAVRILIDEMLPMIDTLWVTDTDHTAALNALLAAGRRQLSLVDCVSFSVMRRLGIREYLGADPHFEEQGFTQFAGG
jgi:predicted nucleic acid-binding protein